ncbi:fructoselysine-6-P-deglycase FrlB-like protein [Devosia sp. UYZn731]|uniref:SIS domain-containing protein n=1 Tax=Devosia sp. UYZn731 TaxID=3156345 RepID=UPI003391DDFF
MNVNVKPAGQLAIEREMAVQERDALASFAGAEGRALEIAASLRRTGRLLMLGMGASHSVGRAMEPYYRAAGVDAVALPISEQLGMPLPLNGRTVLLSSQSGESAEILRWLKEAGTRAETFGLTLDGTSTLARAIPSLVGVGGPELAFAATRSLTVSFGLHLAVLAALGVDTDGALDLLKHPAEVEVAPAVAALDGVTAIVTSGRMLQGVAEAIALGLTELSRLPAFSLEGGQLRHGPMEMLGPKIGVVLFRGGEPTAGLVAGMAASAHAAGSKVVVFDASGLPALPDVVSVRVPAASGPTAVFALLPNAQRFMVAFAALRIADVGTPCRSTKITRTE